VVCARAKGVFVCNDPETAERCRVYECRNTEQSVEQDFERVLRSPAQCGHEYPKLAVLIWFLQDYAAGSRLSRLRRTAGEAVRSVARLLLMRWW
jgi:hypothetical protein